MDWKTNGAKMYGEKLLRYDEEIILAARWGSYRVILAGGVYVPRKMNDRREISSKYYTEKQVTGGTSHMNILVLNTNPIENGGHSLCHLPDFQRG